MRSLSRFSWGLLIFFSANLIVRALLLGYQGDEGEYLTQSMLVARGQIPIVDFFIFNNQVNFYYFYATFILFLGHHFWALRLVSASVSIFSIAVMMCTVEELLAESPLKKLWVALPIIGFYSSTLFFPYTVMILHLLPMTLSLTCMVASLLLLQRALDQGEEPRVGFFIFSTAFFFSAAFFFRSLVIPMVPFLLSYFFYCIGMKAHRWVERVQWGGMMVLGALLPALPSLSILLRARQDFFFNLFGIRLLFQRSPLSGTWTQHLFQNLREFVLGWPWVDLFQRLPNTLKVVTVLKSLPEILLLGLLILSVFRALRSQRIRPSQALPLMVLGGSSLSIFGFIAVQKFQNLGYYAPALLLFYCGVPFLLDQSWISKEDISAVVQRRRLMMVLLVLLAVRFVGDNIGSVGVSRVPHSSRSMETMNRVVDVVRPYVKKGDLIFEYEGLTTFLLDLTPPPGFAQMAGTRMLWEIFTEDQMRRHRIFSPFQAQQFVRRHLFSAVVVPPQVIDSKLLDVLRQEYEMKLSLQGVQVFVRPAGIPVGAGQGNEK